MYSESSPIGNFITWLLKTKTKFNKKEMEFFEMDDGKLEFSVCFHCQQT